MILYDIENKKGENTWAIGNCDERSEIGEQITRSMHNPEISETYHLNSNRKLFTRRWVSSVLV